MKPTPDNEITKKITEKMGEEFAKENPFISSKEFMGLVKIFALMPKITLSAAGSSSEGVNVMISLLVTFLKNVPEPLWMLMEKVFDAQDEGNHAKEMFQHLKALRDYQGDKTINIEMESTSPMDDDDIPPVPMFTSKPPTTPI